MGSFDCPAADKEHSVKKPATKYAIAKAIETAREEKEWFIMRRLLHVYLSLASLTVMLWHTATPSMRLFKLQVINGLSDSGQKLADHWE
jgi:hypothetical protein